MLIRYPDESLRTIRINRGASHAWESLIGDTLPLVRMTIVAHFAREGIACPPAAPFSLGVTQIAAEEPNLGEQVFGVRCTGGWAEVWPIETCDRTIEVLIKFTADGTGGALTDIPGDRIEVMPG